MPNVSIILPIYNSEKYVESTLKSVLAQTYTDWELIIIDDCSTDRSMEIVDKYKNEKFIIIKNSENVGPGISRNRGIEKANGKYIAFIDSDDIWNERKLEYQLNFMKDKEIGFSFSGYERIKCKNDKYIRNVEVPEIVEYEDLLKNTIILTSTVIIDTSKINKKILVFEKLRMSEDLVLFLKILKQGYTAYGYNYVLIKYRVGKKNDFKKRLYSIGNVWRVYKIYEKLKFVDRVKNYFSYIKNALKKRIPMGIFERIVEIKNLITLKEVFDLFLFPFFFVISILLGRNIKHKKVWIIEENPNEACDNGYVFFKYLRENRKDINAYYVINKKSKDYEKVNSLGNIINNYSLKHWIYYLNADKIIITQKYANPSPAIFYILHKKNILKIPRIFLQHGIMLSDISAFYYDRTKFRLFICGAKKEFEYIKNKFGYPNENVVYTGLARFDNLNSQKEQKNIEFLICPTWRNWIRNKNDFKNFFENYLKLLNDTKFIELIEKNNIKVNIVIHKKLKKFKTKVYIKSKNIILNNNEDINIQDLINNADLMITDYSSISCDMAYRLKPIIYYQFDKNDFRKKHLVEGFFSYESDGFGDVEKSADRIVEKVKYYIDNNFKVEEKYYGKMIKFFDMKDKNNCKRILKEIEKI